jgi:hypothetical protein
MALGFPGSGGGQSTREFMQIIKYDARAGVFSKQVRFQTASGEWDKRYDDLDVPFEVLMDFENIEVGWASFMGVPDFAVVKLGGAMPDKPSDDHRPVFRLRLWSEELGVREFASGAATVRNAVDKLHDVYMAERGKHAGKMPRVAITGTSVIEIPTPQGDQRFRVPKWNIAGWEDRPADMGGAAAKPAAPSAQEDDLF